MAIEWQCPDERIFGLVLELAKGLWHLKDRLHQWSRVHGQGEDVDAYARSNADLRLCADLANWKKHGRSENVSGRSPRLEFVKFDTSRCGMVEYFYNGATKQKELLVTNPVPIPFAIPVFEGQGESEIGDCLGITSRALTYWLPLLQRLKVLDGENPEAVELRKRCFPQGAESPNMSGKSQSGA